MFLLLEMESQKGFLLHVADSLDGFSLCQQFLFPIADAKRFSKYNLSYVSYPHFISSPSDTSYQRRPYTYGREECYIT